MNLVPQLSRWRGVLRALPIQTLCCQGRRTDHRRSPQCKVCVTGLDGLRGHIGHLRFHEAIWT